MTLDELAAFVAVLREGGVTRAAAVLGRSQPALSRRIEQLEADLGCPLLDRSPAAGVLGPTEAGRALLPHAEAALAAARDARRAVAAVHRGGAGEVGLAVVGTLATAGLAATLRRFAADFPAARLALRTAASREVSALVRRGEATLGLRYGAEADPLLEAVPAGREALVAVAAGDVAARLASGVGAEALRGLPWIGFPPGRAGGGSFGEALDAALARAGLGDAPRLPVDSLTAQLRLAEAGLGLALVPADAAEDGLARGTLARVPADAPIEASVPVVLVRRCGGYLSAAARALGDFLAEIGGASPAAPSDARRPGPRDAPEG